MQRKGETKIDNASDKMLVDDLSNETRRTLTSKIWIQLTFSMIFWGVGVFFLTLGTYFNRKLTIGTSQLAIATGSLCAAIPYAIFFHSQLGWHRPGWPHVCGFLGGASSALGMVGQF